MGKQVGLAPSKHKVQKTSEPSSKQFGMICNDMYKRFGACFTNLKPLAKTPEETYLLSDQLHQLRTAMRELLQEVKDA
jgi:hypothetical protein